MYSPHEITFHDTIEGIIVAAFLKSPPPSNNRFDSKKPRSGVRNSPYGSRDGSRLNSAAGNSKKNSRSGSNGEKVSSQVVSKGGKKIKEVTQKTDVNGSIRDGLVVNNHSGKGGFKESAVLNPLYHNEGDRSNRNGGVVDGLVSDDGVVVGMNIQEGCDSVLSGVVKEVAGIVQNKDVYDAPVVFEEMPNQNSVLISNSGVGDLNSFVEIVQDPRVVSEKSVFEHMVDQGTQNSFDIRSGPERGSNVGSQEPESEFLSGSGGTGKKLQGPIKLWSDILGRKEGDKRLRFEYHTPEFVEGKVVIKPPLQVDVHRRIAWINCLVGYFFEKRVDFHVMQLHAKRRWEKRGLLAVIMNDEGFFFFKFSNEHDLLSIFEEGVCLVEGKPLVLQRWHPQIVLAKDVP
ncbi:hypothetical protein AgCh_028726 [Apium graveolens]